MSADVYSIFYNLSPEDFRAISRAHEVTRHIDDNEEASETDYEWLERLRPPPIDCIDDLINEARGEHQVCEYQEQQRPRRSYGDVASASLGEVPSTSAVPLRQNQGNQNFKLETNHPKKAKKKGDENKPKTKKIHEDSKKELHGNQQTQCGQRPSKSFVEVASAFCAEELPSTCFEEFEENESWKTVPLKDKKNKKSPLHRLDENTPRVKNTNVNKANSNNKNKSNNHYSYLSNLKVKEQLSSINAIRSISTAKIAINNFKKSITKKESNVCNPVQENNKTVNIAGHVSKKILKIKLHCMNFITSKKCHYTNEKTCNKSTESPPRKTVKQFESPRKKHNRRKGKIKKIFAYNFINILFSFQYFPLLLFVFQKSVLYFHETREQINKSVLCKCTLIYLIIHFGLIKFALWVYIVYNFMKMIYLLILPDNANEKNF